MEMRRLLIDTNIYSYALKGDGDVVEVHPGPKNISLCVLCLPSSILQGYLTGAPLPALLRSVKFVS
jgi:hypothetical protein